jgi:hypothetical protein
LPESTAGRKATCKKCGERFVISFAQPASAKDDFDLDELDEYAEAFPDEAAENDFDAYELESTISGHSAASGRTGGGLVETEPFNPFASPLTDSRPLSVDHHDSDAELIRRKHLNHEASIQGFGSLFTIGGVFLALAAIVTLVGSADALAVALAVTLFLGAIAALYLYVGVGLRNLNPAVKMPATILLAIGLLGFPIGTIINGYGLYLLHSEKGNFILSERYAKIRRQTPHIKYKTSIIVWIFVGLLGAVILLALFAVLIGSLS